jgi:hypothetical protein
MDTYTVEDGEEEFDIEAELLADYSTRGSTRQRWSEVRVFRTSSGSWLVTGAGRSTVEGEVDFCWYKEADDVPALVEQLRLRSGRIVPATMGALLQACVKSPEFRAELMRVDL